MTRAKRIYILIIKVNKLFSFLSSRCFLKETENMYSVFLLSYTNTRESLGELEKAVETLACGSCSTAFLVLPNFHSCLYNSIETRYMFSISQLLYILSFLYGTPPRTCTPCDIKSLTYNQSPSRLMKLL